MTDTSKEEVERLARDMIHARAYAPILYRAADTLSALAAENEALTTGGIAEVAVRNPNVMEYMKHWEVRAEKAEAEIEALRAQAVTVKPLEWGPTTVKGKHLRDTAAVYGRLMYEVGNHEKGGAYLMTNWRGLSHETFPNWDIAKAAAQADYDRRILSAIEARPASEVAREARKEAWEDAIQIVTPATNAKDGLWAKNLRRKVAKIRALIEKEDG